MRGLIAPGCLIALILSPHWNAIMDPNTQPPSVFRSPEFRRYYAGQALSYLGDGLRTLAIPLLVFHLTGSAASLGVTFALEVLPFALFSLLGGSLADRLDRRRLMIGTDAVRFIIMAAFCIALWRGILTLPFIYTGVVLLASCAAIFLGAQASSIPYLLGKDRAKAGVAALVATEQSVNLIAPPLGGAIFGLVGALPALALNALTYLTSQVSIASVATFGPDRPGGFPSLREISSDVAAGFRFVMRDPTMRTLTLSSAAINAAAVFGFIALIPYLKREYGASDQTVGIAFGCFAVGSVAGSLIAGRTHWPFGRALCIAYIADGALWLPIIWTHSLAVAIACVTACSVCGAFQITTIIGWRMRVIPEELIGRVFGMIRLLVLLGMVPGSLFGGAIADAYGTRTVMAISGAAFLLLAFSLMLSPAVRNERR